jgi:hypothetical protein
MFGLKRKYALMDEAVAAEAGGAGGGAVAGAGAEAAPEFTAQLNATSTHQTHEQAAARAAGDALTSEAGGWVDPTKGTVTWEKTGDAVLDMALGFLGQHGYSHHHAAVQAALGGDFSLLEAELAGKGVQGWQQYVQLGKDAFARGQEQAKAVNERIKAQCLAASDGNQQLWDDARSYLSEHADPDEKTAINSALAKGDIVSEAMAHYMVHLFRNASGVTVAPQSGVIDPASATTKTASGTSPLSPMEYGRAVQDLARKIGSGKLAASPEYAALQRRRGAYRG